MLPPTTGVFEEHIERVRVEFSAGRQSCKHGNHQDDKGHTLPAPHDIVELVRCHCKYNCSTHRCLCRRNDLT